MVNETTDRADESTPPGIARVAYVCALFPKLSELFVVREIEELARQGCTPMVFSLLKPRGERLGERTVPTGVRVVHARDGLALVGAHVGEFLRAPVRYLASLGRVVGPALMAPKQFPEALYVYTLAVGWAGELRRSGVEHLHAHFAGAATTATWAMSRLTGIPFGFTAHANDIYVCPYALCRKMRDAVYTVTVTEHNRGHMLRVCGQSGGDVVVLPTGLAEEPMPTARPEAGLIVSVGRLVAKKGFADLVQAMAMLKTRNIDCQCVIAGEGPERGALESLIDRHGLADRVTLLGERTGEEVHALLARATIFALPCVIARDGDRDGLPHSIMEAMAMGVPVVSTRVAGIPELVEHGVSGMLVAPGAAEELAAALGGLLGDGGRRAMLAEGGRRAVRRHCYLPDIVGRLRGLFHAELLRRAAVMVCLYSGLAPVAWAGELFPDPTLQEPQKHVRSYHNFGKSDPIIGWIGSVEPGRVRAESKDREPGARIGMRTLPIPMGTGDYRARLSVSARGVLRSGFYAILVSGDEQELFQTQEIFGPAGDFDRDIDLYITVQPEHARKKAALLLYAFHDGGGSMDLKGVSLVEAEGTERSIAPRRTIKPLFHQLRLSEPLFGAPFRPADDSLLPGERRYASAATSGTLYRLSNRDVAASWEMGIVAPTPYWLDPIETAGEEMEVVGLREGAAAPGVEPLPPLPADRNAYLFYYGAYRYGKKARDLKRDLSEFQALRGQGITGLAFWDDYGLDFHSFLDGKPLDGSYMVEMAKLYREAGFTAPMLFTLFGGIERGRVAWKSADEGEMREYLEQVRPWIDQTRAVLGEVELWVCPVDEPDDLDRQSRAMRVANLWPTVMGDTPMFATVNWQSARRLGSSVKLIAGAGSIPDFAEARKLGIAGGYCSLDSMLPPLTYRWLGGVYTWASGNRLQAYWHHESIAGRLASDIDGHMPDYLARNPETGGPTVAFSQLQEGLMDLRLLLALEQRAATNPDAAQRISPFLEDLRARALPTDRLAAPWDVPETYHQVLQQARLLWRETNGEAAAQAATESSSVGKP